MSLNANMLLETVGLLMIAFSQLYIATAIVENINVDTGVARRIPVPEVAITGAPTHAVTGTSLVRCLKLCLRFSCASFNFGGGICELHETFLCADDRALDARPGVSYYDVEVGDFVKTVDDFRNRPECITANRCSPKCYSPTTSTDATSTDATSPVSMTTAISASEVMYPNFSACSSDSDCLTSNSDCRNGLVCECVAGYSYHETTGACVTSCPGGYGSTFTLTNGFYLFGFNTAVFNDLDTCFEECRLDPGCVSIEYDTLMGECNLGLSSKIGNEDNWMYDSFYEYYQRNCA